MCCQPTDAGAGSGQRSDAEDAVTVPEAERALEDAFILDRDVRRRVPDFAARVRLARAASWQELLEAGARVARSANAFEDTRLGAVLAALAPDGPLRFLMHIPRDGEPDEGGALSQMRVEDDSIVAQVARITPAAFEFRDMIPVSLSEFRGLQSAHSSYLSPTSE